MLLPVLVAVVEEVVAVLPSGRGQEALQPWAQADGACWEDP